MRDEKIEFTEKFQDTDAYKALKEKFNKENPNGNGYDWGNYFYNQILQIIGTIEIYKMRK